LSHLDKEISHIETKNKGKRIIVRLNGISDLAWENMPMRDFKNAFELYPIVQFYDYAKVYSRLTKVKPIKNYYVAFSASESNHSDARTALRLGVNVPMVFKGPDLPSSYKDFAVIDDDTHDFRFLDKGQGIIVGLKAKGPAKRDTTGFVRVA
jgi:hypothetical protein